MLVAPPGELKRLAKIEHEKHQNEVIKGLLNNFDEETVEGDNLTIDDCAIAPLKEFKICGKDIKQEIRQGYNLADTNNIISQTYLGIKITNNKDGSISLNGTATSNAVIRLIEPIQINEENSGVYSVQVLGAPTQDMGYLNIYYIGNVNDEVVRKQNYEIGNSIQINYGCTEGTEVNCTVKPFVVKGNYTAETMPDFEQYGAMPSKDFQSPLKHIEGNQDVEHFNKNISNENDFIDKLSKCCKVETEFVDDIECYKISRITEYRIDYPINFNKIITMQVIAKAEGNVELFIRDINEKKYSFPLNKTLSKKNLTIEGIKSIGVGLYEFNAYIYIAKNSIQLEEGTEETDYVSHQSETCPLDLTNRNLLIYPYTDTSKELYGIKWIDNGDGSVSAKGLAIQDSSFKLCGDINNQKTIKEKYLSGGKNSNEIVRMVTKQNNNYIILANSTGTSTPINLETYQEGYIEIVIKAGTEVNTTFYPMLSNFNTDVYAPYTEPYEYNLYSKNDCIYYDEELEKYFVHNDYEKIIADGINFKFTGKSGTANNNLFIIDNLEIKNKIKKYDNAHIADIYSNYFMKNSGNFLYSNNLQGIAIRVGGDIVIGFGLGSEIDTVEKANQFLMENTVELVYPLAVPTDTKITSKILIEQLDELRKIMTHKGTNHFIVTSENGQSANLKAIVYKDTFKILKEEIDNLKALLLES